MSTKKLFLVLFILIISLSTYLYLSGFLKDLIKPKQEILTITLDQNGYTINIKNGDTIKLALD